MDSLELSSTAEYAPQQFVGEHTTKAFRQLCYIPIWAVVGLYRPTIVILCEVFRQRSHHLGITQPLVLDHRAICLSAFILRWAKRCDYLSVYMTFKIAPTHLIVV